MNSINIENKQSNIKYSFNKIQFMRRHLPIAQRQLLRATRPQPPLFWSREPTRSHLKYQNQCWNFFFKNSKNYHLPAFSLFATHPFVWGLNLSTMFNALSLSSYPPAQYNWQNVHSVDFVFKLNPHHSIEYSNPWPSTRRRKRRSWKPRHCPQVEPHLAIEFQLENQKTVSKILCDVPYCCSRD